MISHPANWTALVHLLAKCGIAHYVHELMTHLNKRCNEYTFTSALEEYATKCWTCSSGNQIIKFVSARMEKYLTLIDAALRARLDRRVSIIEKDLRENGQLSPLGRFTSFGMICEHEYSANVPSAIVVSRHCWSVSGLINLRRIYVSLKYALFHSGACRIQLSSTFQFFKSNVTNIQERIFSMACAKTW